MPAITTKEQIKDEFLKQGILRSSLMVLALRQITECRSDKDKKFGRRLPYKGHHLDYNPTETLTILHEFKRRINRPTTSAKNLREIGIRDENIDLAITRLVYPTS